MEGSSFGHSAFAAVVTVTIARASNVGVKVGIVGRGVIVWVGGTAVRLGVNVAGIRVSVPEEEGSEVLAGVAEAHAVRIKIPLSRLIRICFMACLPTSFIFLL
jgi:hypothetical protein